MRVGKIRNQVKEGQYVAVIQKHHQNTNELTHGVIKDILTKGDHPRGIKVRLTSNVVGRIHQILSETSTTQAEIVPTEHNVDYEMKEPPETTLADFIVTKLNSLANNSIIDEDVLKTWNCKTCTYINGVYSDCCEMCGMERQ
ncbi:hypothetical protein BC833DRAFT_605230 [Globomyces pollinis-pini]|nr:hypothetical protein BC833DRAFT_605230 [Globomyces pollinis-pini]